MGCGVRQWICPVTSPVRIYLGSPSVKIHWQGPPQPQENQRLLRFRIERWCST